MGPRVAVIGAGIIGMTTALKASETCPDAHIDVIADKFTPHTTGDVAAGLFKPYIIKGVPENKMRQWCIDSFAFYSDLLKREDSGRLGLSLMPAYLLSKHSTPRPLHADAFLHYRDVTDKELKNFPDNYKYGSHIISMTIECKKLLPHLMKWFLKRGGRFIEKKVEKLEELFQTYDVIFNCTGVGASFLTSDVELQPVRGHLIRVRAPWIKYAIMGDDDVYIIPNIDEVVLGTTAEVGNFSLIPNEESHKKIWERCVNILPSLKTAEIIADTVGLRPGRTSVRIEREDRVVEGTRKTVTIIHNYGHGGSGVTLSWGCACDAVKILEDVICESRRTGGV
ncbi:unnamed protein product [Ixodes persulcatus]